MLYIQIVSGKAVAAATDHPTNKLCVWESRHDWKTFESAQQRAAELNAANPGANFIPVDSGANVWPRFDIIEAPRVGDLVSYGFNGDSYPDGKIAKISGGEMRIITTDTGNRYYRRKLSGSWVRGGTWSLIQGHHNERNPSF